MGGVSGARTALPGLSAAHVAVIAASSTFIATTMIGMNRSHTRERERQTFLGIDESAYFPLLLPHTPFQKPSPCGERQRLIPAIGSLDRVSGRRVCADCTLCKSKQVLYVMCTYCTRVLGL